MYFALQILKHLLALCGSKTEHTAFTEPTAEPVEPEDGVADPVEVTAGADKAPTLLSLARASTAAALSRELLKLGSSKVEKAIDKEYIKLLSSLALESWIAQYDVSNLTRCATAECDAHIGLFLTGGGSRARCGHGQRVLHARPRLGQVLGAAHADLRYTFNARHLGNAEVRPPLR
jgi:hypothetical protein